MSLSPESVWRDSVSWIFGDRHPRRRAMTPEILDEANFKRVQYIYKNRFSDPNNFTFYFVGNIDLKKVKPLIEQYLGSLQALERDETYKDLGIRPPKGIVEKAVEKGQESKSMEIFRIHGEFEYNQLNVVHLDAISKILATILIEEIREKESGVYAIDASPRMSAKPYPNYFVQIAFGCDPERKDELFEKICNIIKRLQNEYLNDAQIATVKEKLKREFETDVKENSYWRNTLSAIEDGIYSANDFKNYLKDIETINVETMKAAANKYLDLNNYVKVYLVPEK